MNTGFSRKKLYTYDGTYHYVARFLINLMEHHAYGQSLAFQALRHDRFLFSRMH